MKIEISESYAHVSITKMAETIDDEIKYHESSHGCKPTKIIIAPFHEWDLHKESKKTMVICLTDEITSKKGV